MTSVTRRGFFGRLAAVTAGAAAVVTAKPQRFEFNRDAFAFAVDTNGLRYVRQYDPRSDEWISHYEWSDGPTRIKRIQFHETADVPMTPERFNRDMLPVLRAEGYRA
jgi:hypothetical protein